MKKWLSLIMAAVIFSSTLFLFSHSAFADSFTNDEKIQLGTSDTYYEYDSKIKTLIISGSGATPNFTANSVPWYSNRNDGSIEKIVVEEGVTTLGNYLFYQVSASEIQLPYSLRKISSYSLALTNLTACELPFGVTSVGTYAFYNCKMLEKVDIPDTVTILSNRAFQLCTSLESITIPYSVKSIGSYCFYNCTNLQNVVFQSMSAKISISTYCFAMCPKLKSVAFSMNASLGTAAFGFESSGTKYSDVIIEAYESSPAHVYAVTNKFAYETLDKIQMECGVKYNNSYTDETQNDVFLFEFCADESIKYNFYSRGSTDVKATLKDSMGSEICSNDDCAINDRNFLISADLNKGETYILRVESVKSSGDFSVQVYPDVVSSIDTIGCINFNASDYVEQNAEKHFKISDSDLSELILNVNFNNGFSDMMYFSTDYFNASAFEYVDTQKETPYTCGVNYGVIAFGDASGTFDVVISHSYTEKIVAPTVDDDGYTLNTCVLCGEQYKSNFVETTAVSVSGQLVLAEDRRGSHSHNIPYPYAVFYANGRLYETDENGYFSFNTFDSVDITFLNENGSDKTVHFEVDNENFDYGQIAVEGYDFNKDGCSNLKDYQIFLKEKRKEYGEKYLEFFGKFV